MKLCSIGGLALASILPLSCGGSEDLSPLSSETEDALGVRSCDTLVCPAIFACSVVAGRARCSAPRPIAPKSEGVDQNGLVVIRGEKIFPVGLTMGPAPGSLAPNGKGGLEEVSDAGVNFLRTGPSPGGWDETGFAEEDAWEAAAARHGMHTYLYLKDAASVPADGSAEDALLRRIVTRYRDNPGLGVYKGVDEPAWGAHPIPPMERAYQIMHALDPVHPVEIVHAPRNTIAELEAYDPTADIVGTDIYPIGDPMGADSGLPNKTLSVVGDYAQRMETVSERRMGVWMTLQIAWSGVLPPSHTLVMPTRHQERFMTYDAIIHGARGLLYFGGNLPAAWTGRDHLYGWAWTFWESALREVVLEIGAKSALYPALLASDSTLPIRIVGERGFAYTIREVGNEVFLIADRREATEASVTFRGVPAGIAHGEVMFENRSVGVSGGRFTDHFLPYAVHVYRFTR